MDRDAAYRSGAASELDSLFDSITPLRRDTGERAAKSNNAHDLGGASMRDFIYIATRPPRSNSVTLLAKTLRATPFRCPSNGFGLAASFAHQKPRASRDRLWAFSGPSP